MVGERRGQHDHWAPRTTEVSLQGQRDGSDVAVTSCQASGEKNREGGGGDVAGRAMEEGWGGGSGKRKVLSSLMKYSVLSVVFHNAVSPKGVDF